TILAEKMVQAHGTDCLARLLAAYKSSRNLTTAQLRGFAGFLSSIAIAAEVMAHNTGIQDGTLKIADYVVEGQCPACALDACEVTDGIAAAAAADLANDATIAVTFGTIAGAVSAAKTAMDDMGITSSPALNLLNTIGAGAS